MTTRKTAAAKTAAPETSPSGYWSVTLSREAKAFGATYAPGGPYEVSDAMLAELGDAVFGKTPIERAG